MSLIHEYYQQYEKYDKKNIEDVWRRLTYLELCWSWYVYETSTNSTWNWGGLQELLLESQDVSLFHLHLGSFAFCSWKQTLRDTPKVLIVSTTWNDGKVKRGRFQTVEARCWHTILSFVRNLRRWASLCFCTFQNELHMHCYHLSRF